MPAPPFLSDDRKDFSIPPLTSERRFEKASANSESRLS
jgi:hypothetical protein